MTIESGAEAFASAEENVRPCGGGGGRSADAYPFADVLVPNPDLRPAKTTRERRLYEWLVHLAKQQLPAPINGAVAKRFGYASRGGASRLVAFLESTGLIRVERTRTRRRIFVGELQRWTGWSS